MSHVDRDQCGASQENYVLFEGEIYLGPFRGNDADHQLVTRCRELKGMQAERDFSRYDSPPKSFTIIASEEAEYRVLKPV